ncbi:MAG: response regulator [Candidatus Gracilibacteria bacterium]|jgi:DNA-binding NtrC family response regulator
MVDGPEKTPLQRLVEARGLGTEGNHAYCAIVDDDEQMRRLMVRVAGRELSLTCLEGVNGEEGAEIIRNNRERIVLVLSDVQMPKASGPDMLEGLEEGSLDKTAVVVASGGMTIGQKAQLSLLQNIGVVHEFVEKPFDGPTLIAAIQGACQKVLDRMGSGAK